MDNICVYNQIFAMTSFGANIDHSINDGHSPYVFKISSQIDHRIGSLCPSEGEVPRFLQLYIYDTENEINNRMCHFVDRQNNTSLDHSIISTLIQFLDQNNELLQLFRTTRNKCAIAPIQDFKIVLYSLSGIRTYELPTSNSIGGIVFDNSLPSSTDYDVIIEVKDGTPHRINKLHPSYMSLQFPLLFIHDQLGYHHKLKVNDWTSSGQQKSMSMNMYYSYQLHDRLNKYDLLLRWQTFSAIYYRSELLYRTK